MVHFFSNTYDLCTLGVVQCPVKAGNGTAVFKHTVASYQPLVSLYIQLHIVWLENACGLGNLYTVRASVQFRILMTINFRSLLGKQTLDEH